MIRNIFNNILIFLAVETLLPVKRAIENVFCVFSNQTMILKNSIFGIAFVLPLMKPFGKSFWQNLKKFTYS